MTGDEMLLMLEKKLIIVKVGEDYVLTERYKELLEPVKIEPFVPPKVKDLDYALLLNPKQGGSNWPVEILETKGRVRYNTLMDTCDIPIQYNSERGSSYRLRSSSKDAINIISNIIEDITICPNTLMQSIRLYYEHTSYPLSFKNYVVDGLILDIYKEHLEGKLEEALLNDSNKDNSTWQN